MVQANKPLQASTRCISRIIQGQIPLLDWNTYWFEEYIVYIICNPTKFEADYRCRSAYTFYILFWIHSALQEQSCKLSRTFITC